MSAPESDSLDYLLLGDPAAVARGAAIEEQTQSVEAVRTTRVVSVGALLLLALAGACIGSTHVATLRAKPSFLTSSTSWKPGMPTPWDRQAFETRIEFHMPYMDFKEDIYVHSDEPRGLMRLSYYSGANVFLANTSGDSYELLPIVHGLRCLVTPGVTSVERIIPDLDIFYKNGSQRMVDLVDEHGLLSEGYEFTLDTSPASSPMQNASWKSYTPTTQTLYAGKYTFIVNATAGGIPVNLTFLGHNNLMVPSHIDEYHVVYKAFYKRSGPHRIDESFFRPPQGMPCKSFVNVHGPFLGRQAQPLRDLAMAMPGATGDVYRQEVAQSLDEHVRRHPATERVARAQLAFRHFRWVQAANRRGRSYSVGVNHMVSWFPNERKKLCGRLKPQELAAAGQDSAPLEPGCNVVEGIYMPSEDLHQQVVGAIETAATSTIVSSSARKLRRQPMQEGLELLEEVPDRMDWREHGIVGPVKDQGTCGSCWAFGVAGMLEGQWAKATGKYESIAEQQFVDCTWSAGNQGCDGGTDSLGVEWMRKYNGGNFALTSEYGHYLSQDGFCHLEAQGNHSLKLDGCHTMRVQVIGGKTGDLQQARIDMLSSMLVTYGPLSVSLFASLDDFYYYSSGIYDDPACDAEDIDHTVVLVAYGKDPRINNMAYWTIRNSWSAHWGEDGYVRITQKGTSCGVTSYPLIAHLS